MEKIKKHYILITLIIGVLGLAIAFGAWQWPKNNIQNEKLNGSNFFKGSIYNLIKEINSKDTTLEKQEIVEKINGLIVKSENGIIINIAKYHIGNIDKYFVTLSPKDNIKEIFCNNVIKNENDNPEYNSDEANENIKKILFLTCVFNEEWGQSLSILKQWDLIKFGGQITSYYGSDNLILENCQLE
ncbi:MAG: hypothetical protein JW816_00965 [Candidatus Buchananbacteria bacterium]|nr:hypothetical protein [Candidatus Buchananbacteria bacterium]